MNKKSLQNFSPIIAGDGPNRKDIEMSYPGPSTSGTSGENSALQTTEKTPKKPLQCNSENIYSCNIIPSPTILSYTGIRHMDRSDHHYSRVSKDIKRYTVETSKITSQMKKLRIQDENVSSTKSNNVRYGTRVKNVTKTDGRKDNLRPIELYSVTSSEKGVKFTKI